MNQENKSEMNIDMADLTDEKIKNMIIDMNKEQLTIVRNMSYYYLIGHISEKFNEFQKRKHYE